MIVEKYLARIRIADTKSPRTFHLAVFRLFSSSFPSPSCPNIQSLENSKYTPFLISDQVPLLLSVCCIGAMYSMERDKAKALWDQSRRIVDVMIAEECLVPGAYPSWVSQVLFLHCWYAAWLGDNKLLEWALGRRGSLATVPSPSNYLIKYVIRKQIALSRNGPTFTNSTWENWIANESEKRYSSYSLD